jgi:soluble lytic murein transglycosylase-like protein
MQINMKYHPDAFVSLNQAFEPRYNVAYAAHMLGETYKDKGSWETAIRYYHNVNSVYSDKYIARVYTAWRKEDKVISVARLERPSMFMSIRSRPKDEEPDADVTDITQRVLQRFVD